MRDLIFGIGFLLILAAPIVGLGWLVYRFIEGSGGNDYSIK